MPGDFGDSETGRSAWAGTVDPNAPSVANGQISPEQWAEYQKQRRKAAWLGGLTTVGGMLAAGPLANAAFGGGAAAALGPQAAGAAFPGAGLFGAPAAASGASAGAGVGGMGFLSGLGKIAGVVGDLGSVLGNSAKGAADQRYGENNQILDQNRTLLQQLLAGSQEATSRHNTTQGATTTALGQQSNEGLQRAQLGLQAPGVRAHQSILGSLMKNLQPTRISSPEGQRGHETTITGGLSASALDPTTRQHGDELMKAALMAQLSGSDVPKATDFKGGVLASPSPTDFTSGMAETKGSGALEKTLGGGGLIASILAALAKQNQAGVQPNPNMGGG